MMKMRVILFTLSASVLLTGCGSDISSNHKQLRDNSEPTTPAITAEGSETIRSGVHRSNSATILSYADEIKKFLANDFSSSEYRIIPDIKVDTEGSASNIKTVTQNGRPTIACGSGTFSGIQQRIEDCVAKNGTKATWDGKANGASGESTWRLVHLDSAQKEIWYDSRTGMLWSDIQFVDNVSKFNWCKASGNTETEPTDCKTLGNLESICVDRNPEGLESQIKWRLPTRNDFLQADINGLRFVHKKEVDSGLWTATTRGSAVTDAWVYNSSEGTLTTASHNESKYVRCIGAPLL